MADDMYGDGGAEPSPAQTPPESGEEKQDSQTALLPKSFLGEGKQPGSQCTVEVVSDHGDDYEVKYAHSEGDQGAEKTENPVPEAAAPGGGNSMYE